MAGTKKIQIAAAVIVTLICLSVGDFRDCDAGELLECTGNNGSDKEQLETIKTEEKKYSATILKNGITSQIIEKCMVKCHAGTFEMGSPIDEAGNGFSWDSFDSEDSDFDEIQHEVTLSKDFYIAKYPVTQIQYNTIMGENPSRFKGDNNPVESISWFKAKEFCEKLNELTASTRPADYCFDLPTEAQWEYACRAGTLTSFNSGYNISEKCSNLDELGWYEENSEKTTHPVGLKKPNAWGIYDMHGNVWEWCRNLYIHFPASSSIDPEGPCIKTEDSDDEFCCCIRGGCYGSNQNHCRSAVRSNMSPDEKDDITGFRFALVYKSNDINKTEIAKSLKDATDKRNVEIQSELGTIYQSGDGINKDPKEAEAYLKQAADSGDMNAQYALSCMYIKGDGVEKNFEKGLHYCELAAEKGLYKALKTAYSIYTSFDTCDPDFEKAAKYAAILKEHPESSDSDKELFETVRLVENGYLTTVIRKGATEKIIKAGMIKCPAGTFEMGSPADEPGRFDDEIQHKVTFSKDFYIFKYPVTLSQYVAVIGEQPPCYKASEPVVYVNWNGAKEFCKKLNELTSSSRPAGYEFDLPTEAQWEYACRAGTTTPFNDGRNIASGTDCCSILDELGWFCGNSGFSSESGSSDCLIQPVGFKKPNTWGIYDMHGNVWEWCKDRYSVYPSDACVDPEGSDKCSERVCRGGCWANPLENCRSAYRDRDNPKNRSNGVGFRIVLTPCSK